MTTILVRPIFHFIMVLGILITITRFFDAFIEMLLPLYTNTRFLPSKFVDRIFEEYTKSSWFAQEKFDTVPLLGS